MQSPAEIVCTISVQYPHNSSHVPGNINVTANTSCTCPVSEIAVVVEFFLGQTVVGSGDFSNFGAAYLADAATACAPGNYQGGADAQVTFPPGYAPTSSQIMAFSPYQSLTC